MAGAGGSYDAASVGGRRLPGHEAKPTVVGGSDAPVRRLQGTDDVRQWTMSLGKHRHVLAAAALHVRHRQMTAQLSSVHFH